jgi:hypothetical protein
MNSSGKLVYKHFKKGDRIIDFSYAGSTGGGYHVTAVSGERDSHFVRR